MFCMKALFCVRNTPERDKRDRILQKISNLRIFLIGLVNSTKKLYGIVENSLFF